MSGRTSREVLERQVATLRMEVSSLKAELKKFRALGPKPKKPKKNILRVRVPERRVEVTGGAELRAVLRANASWSLRAKERVVALFLARRQKHAPPVPRNVLRAYCKEHRCYDTALFSYYMNDEHYAKSEVWFRSAGDAGWYLTEAALKQAAFIFPEVQP